MTVPIKVRQVAMELLSPLSNVEVRALGIEALRRWRRRPPPPPPSGGGPPPPAPQPVVAVTADVFTAHGDLGLEMFKLLTEGKSAAATPHDLKEVCIDEESLQTPWTAGYLEFVWWLIRAGLVVDLQRNRTGSPVTLRLTQRGAQLVDADDADSPVLPGFLDRIEKRCSGLPDGVIALLVDARACMDHSLMRPAVVLMGLAYELAIEEVVGVLATKGLVNANTPSQLPAKRIERVKELLLDTDKVKLALPTPDERTAASNAYDFADVLRLRRNEAAHTKPKHDFDHGGETEEFLISAGRHLPALWSLAGQRP